MVELQERKEGSKTLGRSVRMAVRSPFIGDGKEDKEVVCGRGSGNTGH